MGFLNTTLQLRQLQQHAISLDAIVFLKEADKLPDDSVPREKEPIESGKEVSGYFTKFLAPSHSTLERDIIFQDSVWIEVDQACLFASLGY